MTRSTSRATSGKFCNPCKSGFRTKEREKQAEQLAQLVREDKRQEAEELMRRWREDRR
jgi:hypothetical protein